MRLVTIGLALLLGWPGHSRLPGQTCREDADCVAPLQCSDGICRYETASRALGQPCVDDLDCEGNLFCNLDQTCDDGRGSASDAVSALL